MAHEAQKSGPRRVAIEPITRLEGHGKIDIFFDEQGKVERAYFQVPELRGFEKFVEGRPAEDMPQITSRICGVCPTAHHMASTKALDAAYHVTPPPAAQCIRRLVYSAFLVEDHALHFYFLGGPDFVVGPQAPKAERNVLGVIAKVGVETGRKVIEMRRKLREIIAVAGGKAGHPVLGLPGGVAKRLTADDRARCQAVAAEAVEFARFTYGVFEKIVLGNRAYVDLIRSDIFTHRTYYTGMVDDENGLDLFDGAIRVMTPEGTEHARFQPADYLDHIAEHVEPWTYAKFTYLKDVGWKGLADGAASGVYCVAPLGRLNAADKIRTPLAQQAYEQFFDVLGGRPVHHTLAIHWARVIELLHAAEWMKELADDERIVDPEIRTLPTATPTEGVGIVEAPRGTLIHHYVVDPRGLIQKANLIVATQHNAARMAMGVERAAQGLIAGGQVSDGVLNMVEMAFRAYDPCLGCATHSVADNTPFVLTLHGADGRPIGTVRRGGDGRILQT